MGSIIGLGLSQEGKLGGDLDPFSSIGENSLEAAEIQADAARNALALQQESMENIRADLAPFVQLGEGSTEKLLGATLDPGSRTLNNPFFQALAQQQQERLGGVAGLEFGDDVLQRNLLESGNVLAQQDINNLTDLVGIGQASAAQVGAQAGESADRQSRLLEEQGSAIASGLVGQANAQGQAGQSALAIGGGLLAAFCDKRLKKNIKPAGTRNGINYYTWEWTDEAKSIVGDQESFGVIAQEVMHQVPDAVIIDATGYFRVNYRKLEAA